MNKAQELLKEDRYWAGIVFQDLENDASPPPPHVKYKIRMDIDEAERTNKLKERYAVSLPKAQRERNTVLNSLKFYSVGI